MKRVHVIGVAAAALAWAVVGHATPASAQAADDVPIIIENLPGAGEELVAGLQETVETLAESQSAVETSGAAGDALVASGSALVAGTEQFGALGFGFQFLNAVTQDFLHPYLNAVDDPATAGDVVNPEDLATLAGNVQPAAEEAQPYAVSGLIQALQGNLNAATFDGVNAAGFGLTNLTAGTNYESVVPVVGVPLLVAVIAGGEYITQLEEGSAPLFEAAAPVTEQVIAVLEGI